MKLSCRWQTARRICANDNDVADLTSVIKIRLEKNWFHVSGLSRSLKVIGTDMDRPAIYDFLLEFYSNFVTKFLRYSTSKMLTLKTGLGVRQGHWICHHSIERMRLPIDVQIVTMALSRVVSEIFNAEKCHDLEIRVRCYSRSSNVVPFDRLGMVSY